AMLKCNAYGHGVFETAHALESESQVVGFGVASFHEAVALRESGVKREIWVFSDGSPWSEDFAHASNAYKLTPVLHSEEDLNSMIALRARGVGRNVEFHLKFNTGMNRLGIPSENVSKVVRRLKE